MVWTAPGGAGQRELDAMGGKVGLAVQGPAHQPSGPAPGLKADRPSPGPFRATLALVARNDRASEARLFPPSPQPLQPGDGLSSWDREPRLAHAGPGLFLRSLIFRVWQPSLLRPLHLAALSCHGATLSFLYSLLLPPPRFLFPAVVCCPRVDEGMCACWMGMFLPP